jgi:hypothetical protein
MLKTTFKNGVILFLLCLTTKCTLGQKVTSRADSIVTIYSKDIIFKEAKSKRIEVVVKVIVNNQGKVIQADPMLKTKTDLEKQISKAAKKEALQIVFDKRKNDYPNEAQFVKITYLTSPK